AARAAKEQIERLNRLIQTAEYEIGETELQFYQAGFANRKRFFARLRAAKASARSPDLQERYLGRAVIAAEIGKISDAVVLHEHRIATIHMKPDAGGYRMVYLLDPYGIHGIHVEGSDGIKGFI